MICIGEPQYYSKALSYGYAVNLQDRKKTTQDCFENSQKRFLLDFDCDPYLKLADAQPTPSRKSFAV